MKSLPFPILRDFEGTVCNFSTPMAKSTGKKSDQNQKTHAKNRIFFSEVDMK